MIFPVAIIESRGRYTLIFFLSFVNNDMLYTAISKYDVLLCTVPI